MMLSLGKADMAFVTIPCTLELMAWTKYARERSNKS